jgi:tetraacyldisaccharide 4'-kinase
MLRCLKYLLWPFSIAYGIVIFFWNTYWQTASKIKLPCRVISVGNIVAGGTGKTPLVIYLANLAVSSGYKRTGKGLVEVTHESDYQSVGDEPLEVCRRVPQAKVYVCESKTLAAQKAFADGAQLIIVDDGFQHRKLSRDCDIVCLDYKRPFDNGHLLPMGHLREYPKALARANCVIFTGSDKPVVSKSLKLAKANLPTFYSRVKLACLVNLKTGEILSIEKATAVKSIAFCGLGSPEKFKSSLTQSGIVPIKFIAFDDHHTYAESDIEKLKAVAKTTGAKILITTHKDAVKLEQIDFSEYTLYYCLIEMEFDNEAAFRKMLGL